MHPIMYRMFFFCDCDFVHFTWTDYIWRQNTKTSVFYFVKTVLYNLWTRGLSRYSCRLTRIVVAATEYTEWQLPISGVHSIMMAGEGGGCTPTPFHDSSHHVQSCSVRSSWVGRYTRPVSSLPIYVLCGCCPLYGGVGGVKIFAWGFSWRIWNVKLDQPFKIACQHYLVAQFTLRRLLWIPSLLFSPASVCRLVCPASYPLPTAYVAWRVGTGLPIAIPAREAGYRFLDSLKGLQIRALAGRHENLFLLGSWPP